LILFNKREAAGNLLIPPSTASADEQLLLPLLEALDALLSALEVVTARNDTARRGRVLILIQSVAATIDTIPREQLALSVGGDRQEGNLRPQ